MTLSSSMQWMGSIQFQWEYSSRGYSIGLLMVLEMTKGMTILLYQGENVLWILWIPLWLFFWRE